MARRRRGNKNRRELDKLLEAGLGAVGIGVLMLLAPSLISNPIIRPALAGLRVPGWIGIIAGLVLIGLYRLGVKMQGQAGAKPAENWSRPSGHRESSAIGEVHEPRERMTSNRPMVADVVSREDLAAMTPAAPTQNSRPEVPGTWSAAVFDIIEWRRFEALCEWLFTQAGFETRTQTHGADGGVDIWLYSKNQPDGAVSVVQCKHWAKKAVGVAEVRALLGSMADKKVRRGIFATTSTFTDDAKRLAKDNAIQLLDRVGLLELIGKRTPAQQLELLAVATKGEFWIPTCASCGVKMMRRARKAGSGFWGCVNFPRCRTVING
jgi:restriction system protein